MFKERIIKTLSGKEFSYEDKIPFPRNKLQNIFSFIFFNNRNMIKLESTKDKSYFTFTNENNKVVDMI